MIYFASLLASNQMKFNPDKCSVIATCDNEMGITT